MALRDWLSGQVATATPATTATDSPSTGPSVATVATVAVANRPNTKPATDDMADGWRRRATVDAWHTDWTATWQRGGLPVSADRVQDAITRTVNAWNVTTGDGRTTAEYRSQLCPADYDDAEAMNRAWLGLYAWTLWHE